MTALPRWVALAAVVLLAAAVPFILAARDPLSDARQRLASMTPAERKSVERSREAYDRLTSLEQLELRELTAELDQLDPKERAELEATMGRLQAWVATFPDEVRARYEQGTAAERRAVLAEQLTKWRDEKKEIVAKARMAEEAAKRSEFAERKGGRDFPFPLRQQVEERIKARGTPEEKALLQLMRSPRLNRLDVELVGLCLAPQRLKASAKVVAWRDPFADLASTGILQRLKFVPAFGRLPNAGEPLGEAHRADLQRTLTQVYLLTPPPELVAMTTVFERLGIVPRDRPTPQPVYLLQQLTLLRDYAEDKAKPPLKDVARVRALLGKSP